MIRAGLRLPRARRRERNTATAPIRTTPSAATTPRITPPPSDEPCEVGRLSESACHDVVESERNRRHVPELDDGCASAGRVDSAGACCAIRVGAAARSAVPRRLDGASRPSASARLPVARCNERAGDCARASADERARTSTALPAAGTAEASFEATAPASSAGAVSRAPASLVVSDATSAARGAGCCTDGGDASAAFDLAGGVTAGAGDAGAEATAGGASGRAAGDVREGRSGKGST